MRVRLTWNNPQDNEKPLFGGIPRGPRTIWATFPGSAVVEGVVVWLVASYLHFLAVLPPVKVVRILDDRVLEIAFDPARKLSAPAPKPAPGGTSAGKRAAGKRSSPARSGAQSEGSSAGAPASALAALREFQMPVAPSKKPVSQTLVQLDLPPTLDVRTQLRVPQLILLSGVTAAKPPTRQYLAPPERKQTAPVPSQVTLDLGPPILDVQAGRAKIPDVVKENPRLPAPVGAKAPVATFREPVPAKHAATVTAELPAPPANIVSLPDRPIPLGSAIVLPPINQISSRDSGFGETGSQGAAGVITRPNESGSGGDGAVASRSGTGDGSRPGAEGRGGGPRDARGSGSGGYANGAGNSAGTGAGASNGTGSAGSGSAGSGAGGNLAGSGSGSAGSGSGRGAGAGSGDRGSGSGSGSGGAGAGGSGTGAAGTGGTGSGASGATALNVRPTTPPAARVAKPIEGNYEIAIVQSSASVPGTSGLLNGRPVYSVYISVGEGKEWILQYCLPADEKQRATRSQVVQLSSPSPLAAPYAYIIMRPNVHLRNGARYGFIHAYVTAAGRFDRMTEVGEPAIENLEAVLESLQKWEFRPAAKDGSPAIVEVLLCIPNA